MAGGHWGCCSASCLALCGWGWILPGLAGGGSFSLSRADLFPEMSLEASFSGMSHFAVLALTPLSKVLKGIYLLFVSSMVLKETLISATFINGLERSCLTDLMFHVLEGNLFPPRLTHGLERSLSASIFDCVTDSVGITLFSDDSYVIYTYGLERSQHVSVLLSPSSCTFGWGLERSLSACAPSHGLDRTGWMVLKELRYNSLVPQWCFAIFRQ